MPDLLTDSLEKIIVRDLDKLASELSLYSDETLIWKIDGEIKNSAGNLCLHLCGNLQYFIGTILGKTGYVRNRDNEFALKGISRENLLKEIAQTKKAVQDTLPSVSPAQLALDFPVEVFGYAMTTGFFLIHLSAHLGYHLGQVNYHRRLVGNSA